jgi:hypothetical protein
MASLAPIEADTFQGFFLAGENENGEGEMRFYSD